MVRLGTEYGGWWVPTQLLQPGAVAYCGGVGEDISFDLELVARGLEVHAFDPTPKAITYIRDYPSLPRGFHFHAMGWYGERARLKFYAPADETHASYSAVNLQSTTSFVWGEVDTVAAIADRLGHADIDIVKMDIEGVAHEVVDDILRHGPRCRCLCVEFDQPVQLRRVLRTVRSLRRAGYRVAHIEGWNFTFVPRPGAERYKRSSI